MSFLIIITRIRHEVFQYFNFANITVLRNFLFLFHVFSIYLYIWWIWWIYKLTNKAHSCVVKINVVCFIVCKIIQLFSASLLHHNREYKNIIIHQFHCHETIVWCNGLWYWINKMVSAEHYNLTYFKLFVLFKYSVKLPSN